MLQGPPEKSQILLKVKKEKKKKKKTYLEFDLGEIFKNIKSFWHVTK